MIDSPNPFASADDLKLMQGFPPPPDKRINRSNALLTPPFNRWSYQNMRMLYPSAGVPNADQHLPIDKDIDDQIAGLEVVKANEGGLPSGETVNLETYLQETYTDSFVVAKDGKIVFEKFLNGMHPRQPHQMMSVTKSFTGLFGLMAVEDDYMNENEPVVKYIPELEVSGAFKEASIGQVMDMSNSMDFSEDYADPESGIRHYGVVLGLMEPIPGKIYTNSIYEFLQTLPIDPAHAHGDIFHYQTPKTDVVNWVTNRVTGESFQDNLYHKLWSKLGTDGETYVLLDKDANLFGGGGLNATPYDLSRFAIMMINGGQFNGSHVVSQSVIQTLSDGASRKAFTNGPEAKGIMGVSVLPDGDWSYRAQWWVRHTPGQEAIMAIGIHGQWIYLDLTRRVAVVKQSSQPESATDYFTAYDIHGFDAVISHLGSQA